ncbi:MAG: aromatic/alkene monooxygenase hydroxylase subunit beta [Chloroflexota bacterium]|nr:aromatic/alkene monooxygenase hydroxylase subunit beta [Chloroflexota bacterium]
MAETNTGSATTAETNTGPAINVTNAEAGAAKFVGSDSRAFNYFKPKGRSASVYEDVTVDVQPDPGRYLLQGWLYAFADGTEGFDASRTKMKSSDWHVFRDPNEQWHRTFYIREANTERQIQQTLAMAKSQNVFATWDESWIKALATHVSTVMHPEYGLGMHVFVPAQRDAMSNMINNAICVNGMDKLRFAQDLALYNLALSENIPSFDGSAHKQTWLKDPVWQGVRENIERLTATPDWAEQLFATNVVYEPLCGELFRSQFVMQFAAPHGDFVTPVLFGLGEYDYEHNLAYSIDLLKLLADDPKYGAENKRIMGEWLAHWTPYSVAAARKLQPIWSQPKIKVVRFEEAYERAKHRFESILERIGVELPKEVQL